MLWGKNIMRLDANEIIGYAPSNQELFLRCIDYPSLRLEHTVAISITGNQA